MEEKYVNEEVRCSTNNGRLYTQSADTSPARHDLFSTWVGSRSGVSMFFGSAASPCMSNVISSERLPEPEKAEPWAASIVILVKQGERCVVKETEGRQP